MLRFGCILAGEERAGCFGLVVFLLGKRELVALVWLYFCWGRESWLLRFSGVLLGKRELVA